MATVEPMKWLVTTIVAALAMAACGGASDGTPQPADSSAAKVAVPAELNPGQEWVLVSGVDNAYGTTLRFDPGDISGRAPVNSYFGPGTATAEGGMEVGPLASTKMGGPKERMTAEDEYLRLLESSDGWRIVDEQLELTQGGDSTLVFAGPGSPADFGRSLVGMSKKQAKAAAAKAGYTIRVVSVDGDNRPVTTDYRPDRLNLKIVDGKVTEVTSG